MVKWLACLAAVALASLWALPLNAVSAQEPRDPLIRPAEGGKESRFQVVGQVDWTPGESVTVRLAFTRSNPLTFDGPFPVEHQVTVLRDGTWSFPVTLRPDLFPMQLENPGYVVVRAESSGRVAQNAFVFSPSGMRPVDAEALGLLGFGPADVDAGAALTAALFLSATGTLIAFSGAWRRRHPAAL